ncbi:MAG: hypothetical protein CMD65_03425 [Gammaproteobacteria bacterium]|nr:hypothetical protein [Gammaproteobacteria bacterium]
MNNYRTKIIKDDEIDFKAMFQLFWNDRKKIIVIVFFISILGAIYSLLATPLYKSKITLYPTIEDTNNKLGQLQGMATSLGINIGNESTSFNIIDIVKSRTIKKSLIYNSWTTKNFESPVDLIQYWEINNNKFSYNPIIWIKKLVNLIISNEDSDPDSKILKWEESAINIFNKRLNVSESQTGLISIEILMEDPQLASDIVNKIHPLIIEFTNQEYVKQAKLERQFIEERQKEIEVQLINTENALKKFREQNRNIINSPQLQLEMERLLREQEIKTQVYITLQQQNELARINEFKEIPSVIILDEGMPPSEKDRPNRKLIVVFCMLIGIFLGVIISILNNLFREDNDVK